jgi:hypothetical protein
MMDGEEVAGAKQNRVLNTSILLKKSSETVIPVSCTERGRWSYNSEHFSESGTVMPPSGRGRKNRSVSRSLEGKREFRANQSQVWDSVEELSKEADAPSPTDAMRDVFERRSRDIDDYVDNFDVREQQSGLLVFINGRPVGMDVLSRPEAYSIMHRKLVRSYAMEALIRRGDQAAEPSVDKARTFLVACRGCEEKKFRSVGHGWDHRLESPGVVGTALVYYKKVIHGAFFHVDDEDDRGISGFGQRRRFRL